MLCIIENLIPNQLIQYMLKSSYLIEPDKTTLSNTKMEYFPHINIKI